MAFLWQQPRRRVRWALFVGSLCGTFRFGRFGVFQRAVRQLFGRTRRVWLQ
jgi:hypothetical protein